MAAMSTGRPRGRPRTDSGFAATGRPALIAAAAELFADRGYDGVTVDGVVQRAGLSKGTFYHHFETKQALFLAVVEDRLDQPARELMQMTSRAQPDTPTAGRVSAELGRLAHRERESVLLAEELRLRAAREESARPLWQRRQAAMRTALAATLRARHAATGVPLTFDPERLAEAFIVLAQGLALEMASDPEHVDTALYGDILALAYDGLVARSEVDR
jgi:AcrR family transcriptional regulator